MKTGTVIRTRVVALFAMLLMFFGIAGGLPGMDAADGGMKPFVASAMASAGLGVNDMFDNITNTMSQLDGNRSAGGMDTITTKAQDIAQMITTVLTIISFVCLLFYIARLAMSAGNPMSRRQALTGILFSGVALALFGGAWVVVSFFWNFLNA